MVVLWLVRLYFGNRYSFVSPSKLTKRSSSVWSYLITIRRPSTKSITPGPSATTCVRESLIRFPSNPVPTIGACGLMIGTAWRIMFDPIKARLASSCSRKGINEAAIEAIWFGATSIKSIFSTSSTGKSPSLRDFALLFTKWPSPSTFALACAITSPSSSSAERYFTPSPLRSTTAFSTFR